MSMMILFSLLPQGALQAWASVSHGLWYARSAEFMHQPLMHLVVWMRVPGDIVFSAGPVLLGIFAWKLVRAVRASARQRGAGPLPVPVPAQPAE